MISCVSLLKYKLNQGLLPLENSPAIDGWVKASSNNQVPSGTADRFFRPSGTRMISLNALPSAQALGYFQSISGCCSALPSRCAWTKGFIGGGASTLSEDLVHEIVRLSFGERRNCSMSAIEIYTCLRDLQVVATTPHISEEQIVELLKRKLIGRTGKAGGIWLTVLGVHTKTGQA